MNLDPGSRRTDPVTSKLAASQAKKLQAKHHELILETLKACGRGGKDRIAWLSFLDGVAVARRLPELYRLGLISPTGRLVRSDTGRLEREWEAVS